MQVALPQTLCRRPLHQLTGLSLTASQPLFLSSPISSNQSQFNNFQMQATFTELLS
jgi:hypothetical protein